MADTAGNTSVKTTRQSSHLSCDACRVRKARCHRNTPLVIDNQLAVMPCNNCVTWDQQCSYYTGHRKRGRKDLSLEQLNKRHRGQRGRTESSEVSDEREHDEVQSQPHDPDVQLDVATLRVTAQYGLASSTQPCRGISLDKHQLGNHETGSSHDFISRELVESILAIYFTHVYAIIPLVHHPTFTACFARDESEWSLRFLALLLAVISATLVHVPRSFLPEVDMRNLSLSCLTTCENLMWQEREEPDLDYVCTKYLVMTIHNKHGHKAVETALHGGLINLCLMLELDRESSYIGMDPIEGERRRRLWYLTYNADQFLGIFENRAVLLRSDEYMSPGSTGLPKELCDDARITAQRYLPPSIGLPLITGFNILSRVVRVAGDIHMAQRMIQYRPIADLGRSLDCVQMVQSFASKLEAVSAHLPEPYRVLSVLNMDIRSRAQQDQTLEDLTRFMRDPGEYSAGPAEGLLVLKANIHVSLSMARLRLMQLRKLVADCNFAVRFDTAAETYQSVYGDLLKILHSFPVQTLVVNGPSLVTKLRVVAVTLLDTLEGSDRRDNEEGDSLSYLLEFLSIMTNIEQEGGI